MLFGKSTTHAQKQREKEEARDDQWHFILLFILVYFCDRKGRHFCLRILYMHYFFILEQPCSQNIKQQLKRVLVGHSFLVFKRFSTAIRKGKYTVHTTHFRAAGVADFFCPGIVFMFWWNYAQTGNIRLCNDLFLASGAFRHLFDFCGDCRVQLIDNRELKSCNRDYRDAAQVAWHMRMHN